ncbi:hypothetical protein Pcinc_021043 [Petrolisthes cinctipes]|uniref:Uncharacterized protein n=1 Tax=Petrolisthes cinctipes TaxID=88211 RepID=A0AAE1FH64_PETCI|nr:hypothetical protein Pcinc_021043 [Petrolisthes cinctipes]
MTPYYPQLRSSRVGPGRTHRTAMAQSTSQDNTTSFATCLAGRDHGNPQNKLCMVLEGFQMKWAISYSVKMVQSLLLEVS